MDGISKLLCMMDKHVTMASELAKSVDRLMTVVEALTEENVTFRKRIEALEARPIGKRPSRYTYG